MNEKDIESIHALYQHEVKLNLPYNRHEHETDWTSFLLRFTPGDLVLVVAYLRDLYRGNPEVLASTLRFRHLIRNLDYFAEYLAEARARSRVKERKHDAKAHTGGCSPNPPPSDKEAVLRMTGRGPAPLPESEKARHVKQVIDKLKQLKKDLGMEP